MLSEELLKKTLTLTVGQHLRHAEITNIMSVVVGVNIMHGYSSAAATTRASAMLAQVLREIADTYEERMSKLICDVDAAQSKKEKP